MSILFSPLLYLNRDYVTYMLTLVVLYLTFPAVTMYSCYNSIYAHFKKIHYHRVILTQWSPDPSFYERANYFYSVLMYLFCFDIWIHQCFVNLTVQLNNLLSCES